MKKYLKISGSIILTITVMVVIVFAFSKNIPYDMDEFSLYHELACQFYPANELNTFRVGCDEFDLKLPWLGTVLPLREYSYMGSITSLYYWPVFLLWPSPPSARLMGLLFMIIQSLILSKIFKIKKEYLFLILLIFFQYSFLHIVDTGVVGLQITLIYLIYYLAVRLKAENNFLILAITGFLLWLGLWAKLTFFWLLPALLIVIGKNLYGVIKKNAPPKKTIIKQIVWAALIFLALSSFLFLATDNNGRLYLSELNGRYGEPLTLQGYWAKFHPKTIWNSSIFQYYINPLLASERIYEVEKSPLVILAGIIFYFPALFIVYQYFWDKKRKYNHEQLTKAFTNICLFMLTAIIIYFTRGAWSAHHAVLAMPFLILAYGEMAMIKIPGNKKLLAWVILMLIINTGLWTTFTRQNLNVFDDFNKNKINILLQNEQLADQYIYVVLDWGMYYYQALYGNKNQAVIYIEPLNKTEQLAVVRDLARQEKRKLLFIYNQKTETANMEMLEKEIKLIPCPAMAGQSWNILLENSVESDKLCL
ncbi:MAG TPA: hypothetical protein PLR18_01465 [bacterium]|nr:hypothetical protein [bacterium]